LQNIICLINTVSRFVNYIYLTVVNYSLQMWIIDYLINIVSQFVKLGLTTVNYG
jgi:hypothetical protein